MVGAAAGHTRHVVGLLGLTITLAGEVGTTRHGETGLHHHHRGVGVPIHHRGPDGRTHHHHRRVGAPTRRRGPDGRTHHHRRGGVPIRHLGPDGPTRVLGTGETTYLPGTDVPTRHGEPDVPIHHRGPGVHCHQGGPDVLSGGLVTDAIFLHLGGDPPTHRLGTTVPTMTPGAGTAGGTRAGWTVHHPPSVTGGVMITL